MKLSVRSVEKGLVFSIMISVLVYAVFFFLSDYETILNSLSGINPLLLLLLVFLTFLGYLVRFFRWELFIKNAGISVKLVDSFKVFFAGLGMTITPGKAGELFKASFLKKYSNISRVHAMVIVVLERLFDLAGFSVLILVSLLFAGFNNYAEVGIIGSGVVLFVMFCLFLLVRVKKVQEWIILFCQKVGFLQKRLDTIKQVVRDYSSISIPTLFLVLVLSVVGWFFESFELWLLFQSFGVGASVFDAGFVFGISSLVGILSLLPGGIGGFEASSGLLTTQVLGISVGLSAVITFIIRLTTLWFAVIIGLLSYFSWFKKG